MFQKVSFISVFLSLFCGLAWWSTKLSYSVPIEIATVQRSEESILNRDFNRTALLETLDRIVSYEHYYRSVYGHFTKLINRIGLPLSRSLVEVYDIRVADASSDRLLVTALSEVNGKVLDVVSIDHDFQIHANFELPVPRVEYLKSRALKHLRLIREAPSGQIVSEQAVFKGFFKYTLTEDSRGHKISIATGVRAPVTGVRLELGDEAPKSSDFEPEVSLLLDLVEDISGGSNGESGSKQTGQTSGETLNQTTHLQEETFLAQKIFLGETGRYAKTWSELSRIARFHFVGKDLDTGGEGVPDGNVMSRARQFSPVSQNQIPPVSSTGNGRAIHRNVSSESQGKMLEIEAIQLDPGHE